MTNQFHRFRGMSALLTATVFYGMYGIFSRFIGEDFGAFYQNWVRNLIVAFFCLLAIWAKREQLVKIKKQDTKWVIFWLLSGSWVTVLTFVAFNNLNIGTTYLLIYCSMITSGYLSGKIFFSEKMSLHKYISLFLVFAGLLVIFRFSVETKDTVYIIMALVSGSMTGLWNTLSKKFSDKYPNTQLVLLDSMASVAVAFAGSLAFREAFPTSVSGSGWVWLILYAFVQFINVGLVIYGFKNLEAQLGSIILPIEIVFATLFGFLFFKETQSFYSLVGATLIILGAITPNLDLRTAKKVINEGTGKG